MWGRTPEACEPRNRESCILSLALQLTKARGLASVSVPST